MKLFEIDKKQAKQGDNITLATCRLL